MKELVNRQGEREPQPLANVDFRPIDAVHLPPNHIRTGCELRSRGRKGNADLRGEGILPSKGICARLEPGNNTVDIRTRENFPGRKRRKRWFLTYATIGGTFSMDHLMSSSEPLPEQCLGRQARKSSGPDKKKNKRKEGKTKWKEREESRFF